MDSSAGITSPRSIPVATPVAVPANRADSKHHQRHGAHNRQTTASTTHDVARRVPRARPLNVSPLIGLWMHPRRTTQRLLQHNQPLMLPILAALAGVGVVKMLPFINHHGVHQPLTTLLSGGLLAGTLLGLVAWPIMGTLLHLAARNMGGTGNWRNSVLIGGWSTLPLAFMGIALPLMVLLIGPQLYDNPSHHLGMPLSGVQVCTVLAAGILMLWHLVIMAGVVGELHGLTGKSSFLCVCWCFACLTAMFLLLHLAAKSAGWV